MYCSTRFIIHFLDSISEPNDLESQARLVLTEYDRQSSEKCFKAASANWNYATDIKDETERIKLQESLENAKFQKEAWKNITEQFKTRETFQDPVLQRILKKIAIIGTSASALPEERLKQVNGCKHFPGHYLHNLVLVVSATEKHHVENLQYGKDMRLPG